MSTLWLPVRLYVKFPRPGPRTRIFQVVLLGASFWNIDCQSSFISTNIKQKLKAKKDQKHVLYK